jgi:putative molybdopterin biosynthesis protein
VAIDLLGGALADRGLELVSANVGSIAGLAALRAQAAHLAGTHAIDPHDGSYNTNAVRRYGPREAVALVHFAQREQGLIVARGNPLGLRDLGDLVASGARFVNRQKDAGTRMLFDLLLGRAGIAAAAIAGYERLEFTHVAAAALVADGSADAALGIRAAAVALGCDFVPLTVEPYELALPARSLDEPQILELLGALRSADLRRRIDALPGYDARAAGAVRIVEP